MGNARRIWPAWPATLVCALALTACEDAAPVDITDDTGSPSDTDTEEPLPAEAMVSGEAGREFSTCPPNQDGIGTLCFFLLETCDDLSSAVSSMAVEDANMSWPQDMIPFELGEVPDGTWQLWGFLDDDSSGCEGDVTYGDFYLATGCVEVTVTDQADVTGLQVIFDSKCPAD